MGELKVSIDLEAVEAKSARGHALDFPTTMLSRAIDAVLGAIASVVDWIWVVLVGLIVVNVTLRYALGTNFIAMEELQWHLYAIGFLVGIAYALTVDGHVRVDVLAESFRPRTRAWFEALGLGLFVLPLCWIILQYAWPFVLRAWTINEISAAPGGLTNRWLIKAAILLAFGLLAAAALSRLSRVLAALSSRDYGR